MNALFAAIGFPEVLLIAGTFSISILVTVLWVWMLIVCIRRVVEGDQRQIPWLVAMIVTTGLGAVVYWIVVHRRYHRPVPKPHTALRNPVYCPHCGKPLTTLSVQGICPECMLQAGLGTQGPDATEAKFTPPSIEKLAPYFPQLELLELLGRGGMGAVYKARQRELNRLVALKVLPSEKAERDPAFAERFAREARALAQLAHPNIVAVHDFGQAGGHCYLLMEYVDGLNLRQLLQRGTMKPEEAVAIVPFICEALQFAHQHGIVHRDIKPENILVDSQGRVKIADFGIAKIIGAETERNNLTEPRQTIGTPHYMAPEQVEKPSTVDHRADIYSLGVVFYEMLTGELPLGRFASPSQKVQVDVRLDEVVLRALEKEPSRRYQQASQVKTAVDTILSEPIGSQSMRQTPKPGASLNYRSKATLFGLPLLHVTDGNDPETGLPRVARGIIAVGPVAIGAVAAGGRAQGLIAFGGLAIGGFAFGGCAIGIVSIGGAALALGLALGGFALAPVALGGGAVGVFATGGGAYGLHAMGANANDPIARAFFNPWAPFLLGHIAFFTMLALGGMVPFLLLPFWLRRRLQSHSPRSGTRIGITVFLMLTVLGSLLAAGIKSGRTTHASRLVWSPRVLAGDKPDPAAISAEAISLRERGRFEEALQRHLWLHRHGLEYAPGNGGVRLSFWLADWMELGRRYPEAKQALIEIRDEKSALLVAGNGDVDLVSDVAAINRELGQNSESVRLYKKLLESDPALARRAYFHVETVLIQNGEYALALEGMKDPKTRFESMKRSFDALRRFEQRRTPNQSAVDHLPEGPPLPAPPAFAEPHFVEEVGGLVEVLLATDRKAEAEAYLREALVLLDVPLLRSAIPDAEKRILSHRKP
jgi:predicted Ser/Thr protein kinase/tetratricopeptide (TPR) repeat protein